MHIAMVLFRYFPYGGLQRDFFHMANLLHQKGHTIEVFTMVWEGDVPDFLKVNRVTVKGFLNYQRYSRFAKKVKQEIDKGSFDAVIGFNKMPGLDFYYAADPCFYAAMAERYFSFLYRYIPRYRYFYQAEAAVFSTESKTKALLIAPKEREKFAQYYCTPLERLYLLPPGIQRNRIRPANASIVRREKRQHLGIGQEQLLVLMIGSGFKTKGVDRALHAFAALPKEFKNRTKFIVIGQDRPAKFLRLAKALKISKNFTILNGSDNIPDFLLAADLLIHPAYRENTGTVLLEALCAGLPVLTTEVCGYAFYIEESQAGCVLPAPFSQHQLNETLRKMLHDDLGRRRWSKNAVAFSKEGDLYSLQEQAVALIEQHKHGQKNNGN